MEDSEKQEKPAMRSSEYLRTFLEVLVVALMLVNLIGKIPDLLTYSVLFVVGLIVFLALLNLYGKS